MGRKIPGRKHRGVKDPEQQAAVRWAKLKNKINNPPSNPDDQQIPKSLQRIIDLKHRTKNGELTRRPKKKQKNSEPTAPINLNKQKSRSNSIPEKPTPVFKRKPGEKDRDFIRRMNKICMDVKKEVRFEDKYGVNILRNKEGEVEGVVKRPKDELEVLLKKVRKEKKEKKLKKKKKTNPGQEITKVTKSQKWQQKKKEKKLKKKMKTEDAFEISKDTVKFGDIVHAPPTLTIPKKFSKSETTPKPGKKGLLLKSLIENGGPSSSSSQPNTKKDNIRKTINKTIDRKGKRKELPHALRRQLDKQQKECIEAYKQLKHKKHAGI